MRLFGKRNTTAEAIVTEEMKRKRDEDMEVEREFQARIERVLRTLDAEARALYRRKLGHGG